MKKSLEDVERQIYELRKTVRYDIRELTVEVISSKYDESIDEENHSDKNFNCIYVPEYQRDFTWDIKRQSRLIESIILGLPIPLIFVAENNDSSWEIVDGSQRIRTLHSFINNKLELKGLERLTNLNHYKFEELDKSRQGKFLNTALRMIVLSEETTDQVKKDMFERINRGSDLLKPMEKRKGIYKGSFNKFIYDYCNNNKKLKRLAPVDKWLQNRQESEELILRFFALIEKDTYKHGIKGGITGHLDKFLESKNKELDSLEPETLEQQIKGYKSQIDDVLDFVDKHFPYGFRPTHNPQTKRAVFEAVSVGVHLFLQKNNSLEINVDKEYICESLKSDEFRQNAYIANELHKKKKLFGRVNYIVKMLEG